MARYQFTVTRVTLEAPVTREQALAGFAEDLVQELGCDPNLAQFIRVVNCTEMLGAEETDFDFIVDTDLDLEPNQEFVCDYDIRMINR